jgi:hypothetical protein
MAAAEGVWQRAEANVKGGKRGRCSRGAIAFSFFWKTGTRSLEEEGEGLGGGGEAREEGRETWKFGGVFKGYCCNYFFYENLYI